MDKAGSVRLLISGVDSGVVTTVPGFNSSADHTLSYTMDTTPGIGTISNIQLDSVNVALTAPVNTFTVARTVLGGFYNSSGTASDVATFDNFSVSAVPEPSSLALFGSASLLLASLQFLRRTRR